MILDKGANVNVKGFRGFTPLMQAILERHVEVVKVLLEYGANPNQRSVDNGTALGVSVCGKDMAENIDNAALKIFKLLIKYGAGASVNTKTRNFWTPLHNASKYGKVEEVEVLINLGADIEAKTDFGFTPLLSACENGQLSTVKTLVRAGAKMDARAHFLALRGGTSLHFAVNSDEIDIVKFLVQSGADVKATNLRGDTPLEMAIEKKKYGLSVDNRITEFLIAMENGECPYCIDRNDPWKYPF